ncbi:hypothetical protein OG689_44450 [Kitasatospora sp. NBC_00240]|uniref:hypothetical protein n=1 Tax=Kitasatospora sp. NBC_00240 TaxID=2903567 RepID=UPI0022594D9E|nr:hypothetical protein [Kitasatospora sp. NBC_00240]MCX5216190.1 hypothetical protein [Kitasatospora sp. NBC_00240]
MSTPPESQQGPASPLFDEDERRVAQARRRLTQLGAALVRNPLDREVHQEVRAFFEAESESALRSWEVLLTRSPDELRARIRAVLTAQVEQCAVPAAGERRAS